MVHLRIVLTNTFKTRTAKAISMVVNNVTNIIKVIPIEPANKKAGKQDAK